MVHIFWNLNFFLAKCLDEFSMSVHTDRALKLLLTMVILLNYNFFSNPGKKGAPDLGLTYYKLKWYIYLGAKTHLTFWIWYSGLEITIVALNMYFMTNPIQAPAKCLSSSTPMSTNEKWCIWSI